MSIKFRLNALIVSVFTLGLVSLVLALLISAGPRIHAENDSIMRLAEEFVETTVESLQGTPDPGARLAVLLKGLKDLRHVHIYKVDDPVDPLPPEDPPSGEAPGWLANFGRPHPGVEVPVAVNGQSFGTIIIAPRFSDEADEIWSSIVNFTLGGTALAVAAVLLMSATIAHLLKPIKSVGNALMVLEEGRYDVIVPESGPPEISDICRKLNQLATTLENTISENRRLAERIIRVQDEERKDLARELHDELGPYLFAIRAAVSAHKAEIQRGSKDRQKLLQTCDTLVERIETIQRMNRAVLHKLRPMGLEEYGLKAKLTSLVAMLRESHPDIDVNLAVDDRLPACGETSNLTIYRLVQEGLTNALRHAQATVIDVAIVPATADEMPSSMRAKAAASVHVIVADNGRGLPAGVKPNYGIAGMSERVWATGGEMRMTSRPSGGLTLDAWVPVQSSHAQPQA